MEIASIEAGSTININRSDGRVHPAVVVAVNQDGKFVRVEWFENGETKGKDIDFSVATMLNPNLKVIADPLEPVVQAIDDSLVNKFQRRGIPVNNRRTNIGKRKCGINDNTFNDVKSPIEIIPKLYATRSQSKDLSMQGSIVQDLSKVERCKSERKQRQPIVNEKKENSRKCGVNGYGLLADMVSEYRGKLKFSPLLMDDAVEDHLIMVCVRKRPMNRHEINKNEVDIVSIPRKNHLIVHEPKTKVDLTKYIENHNFKFDYAFDESCDNSLVYKYTAQPLVKTIFNGGFATCFAYGQTGSGKTYTMSGDLVGSDVGIYALAISDVFKLVNSAKFKPLNLSVSCSFFEIYSGKVLDLLNSKGNLRILEDAKQQVQVVGLKEKCVVNTSEVMSLISKGNILRTSGQTSANSNSSRSHAVFQIFLRNHGVVHGKLSLIDLAGNERGADTYTADRQTRLEGGEINKSLLALKECIRALGRKGAHLPFRVSKLTQVLRDSFVGNNSRTCMIAMVSPSVCSCENTLNTLRYADRVKELGTGDTQANEPNKVTSPELIESMPFIENGDNPTTELQRVEKKIFNNHKLILSKLAETEKEGHHLLMMTTNFDFDKKSYVNKYETLIDETISHLLVTKDFIDEYKTKLSRH